MHAPLATEKARFTDPHVKAYALLQAHFSRTALSADMAADQRTVLLKATRLLQVLLWPSPSDHKLCRCGMCTAVHTSMSAIWPQLRTLCCSRPTPLPAGTG